MRELLLLGVPHVAEADGLRERVDGRLVAREEVPALGAALAAVLAHDRAFLRRRHLGRLARVEADGEDVELGSDAHAQRAQAAHEAVRRHPAEHRAVEVDEGEDDGLLPEVVAQVDGLARLVAEREVERHQVADLLVEADVLQRAGPAAAPRRAARPARSRGARRRARAQSASASGGENGSLLHLGSGRGAAAPCGAGSPSRRRSRARGRRGCGRGSSTRPSRTIRRGRRPPGRGGSSGPSRGRPAGAPRPAGS